MAVLLWMLAVALGAEEASFSGAMKLFHHNDKAYVTVDALAEEAGLAVKSLPGQDEWVACKDDRCALVRDCRVNGADTLVSIEELARVLSAKVVYNDGRTTARLEFDSAPVQAGVGVGAVEVGQLAPDFRLPRLDGSSIALSELRGRRVLINSWASW